MTDLNRLDSPTLSADSTVLLPLDPPDTSRTGVVAEELLSTGEAANAVVEGKSALPPEVRARVEELFTYMEKRMAEVGDGMWRKTEEDVRMSVELAGLLYEYGNQIPELGQRTGNKLNTTVVRKMLKDTKTLSAVEEKALELLVNQIPERSQKDRRYDDKEKKKIIAAVRLLRKRDLSTDAANEFLKTRLISQQGVYTWKSFSETETGEPIVTSKLVSRVFSKAEEELQAATGTDDTSAVNATPESVPKEVPQIDTTTVTAVSPQSTAQETSMLSLQQPPMGEDDRKLVNDLVLQQAQIIEILKGTDSNSAAAHSCRLLLETTASLVHKLLGVPATKTEADKDPVAVSDGNIHISHDVLELVRRGEISATIQVAEDIGTKKTTVLLKKASATAESNLKS